MSVPVFMVIHLIPTEKFDQNQTCKPCSSTGENSKGSAMLYFGITSFCAILSPNIPIFLHKNMNLIIWNLCKLYVSIWPKYETKDENVLVKCTFPSSLQSSLICMCCSVQQNQWFKLYTAGAEIFWRFELWLRKATPRLIYVVEIQVKLLKQFQGKWQAVYSDVFLQCSWSDTEACSVIYIYIDRLSIFLKGISR